jgi:hypothetical protein
MLNPIRSNHLTPLPVEDFQIFGRPRTGHPVWGRGSRRVARAAREIHYHRYSKLFGEQDGFAAYVAIVPSPGVVWMQRIAVRAQRAYGSAVISQYLLELVEGYRVFKHR